jgi:hypothetical protein
MSQKHILPTGMISRGTYGDVRHCSKVIDLVWFYFRYNMEQIRGIRQVTIVEEQTDAGLPWR